MTHAANAPGFSVARGEQLTKELIYEVMARQSAASQLSKLWADTFLTNAGINSGTSTGYTYRGSANFDVIVNTTPPAAHEAMTSNSLPVPLVASSDSATGAQLAWMIFDYETATNYWQASGAYPHWAKIDLGSAKTITTYKITTYDGVNYPTHWTLEGSNDNSAWTVIDTVTTGQNSTDREYTIASPGSYRYYKFNYTAGTNQEILWRAAKFYLAGASQAVVKSVTVTMPAAITSALVFVHSSAAVDLVRISTDSGSTWTTVSATDLATNTQEGNIINVPSGTGVILEVTFSGAVELEAWGFAGV